MRRTIIFPLALFAAGMAMFVFSRGYAQETEKEVIPIGSQRQLFLDDQWLISSMENVEVLVHQPQRRELSDIRNRPW
ncbi:MAG: hypothetical protein J6S27_01275, partial [Thermoguttaceae bacterium]|nr:hypothetical protein [Thermoguttaceae bacterium]